MWKALSLSCAIVFVCAGYVVAQPAHPAVNEPDRFAWELFTRINQPSGNGTNDVKWETWATDEETFPLNPVAGIPPVWPGNAPRAKMLHESRQMEIANRVRMRQFGIHPRITPGGGQEVRRNKEAFDFIVTEELWHRDGLIAAFNAGRTVSFPVEAIEIKAVWKVIIESDKPRYHWNVDNNGTLFGLTGLHVTTKDLPNWFWATFEHLDNPNFGTGVGCGDDFGATTPGDCSSTMSTELTTLIQTAGLGNQWLNYRLVDSQVDFVDSTGRPTVVANSEIEGAFMLTSSCITCHAKAAVLASGNLLPIFKSFGPLEGDIGIPNPDWFWSSAQPQTRKALQLDFVWGFLAAQPLSSPRSAPADSFVARRSWSGLAPRSVDIDDKDKQQAAAKQAVQLAISVAQDDDSRLVQVFQDSLKAAIAPELLGLDGGPQPTLAIETSGLSLSRIALLSDPTLIKNTAEMIRTFNVRPRIVGGTATNDFPDCVAVGSGGSWCCTGTLIAANIVLTAGHCFGGCSARVFVGTNTDDATTGKAYAVKQAIRHPGFNGSTLENDLTLLILAENVPDVKPRAIASATQIDTSSDIRAVGFGTTNFNGTVGYGIKRMVDLPIRTNLCTISDAGEIGCHVNKEFAAGNPLLNRDTCRGDSGGPAYVYVDEKWYLAGATSRATSEAARMCGDGGIYVRLDSYIDWIQSVMLAENPQ